MSSRKSIIFVPGFPASELVDTIAGKRIFPPSVGDLLDKEKKKRLLNKLSGPNDQSAFDHVVATRPIKSVKILNIEVSRQAQTLYSLIQEIGYDTSPDSTEFYPIGWDWRKSVYDKDVQHRVESTILELGRQQKKSVVLIAHSTGGLVIRALLESKPELVRYIDHLIAFGVPWAGTLSAFKAASVGAAAGALICKITKSESVRFLRKSHAIYDLMPPDPKKTNLTDSQGRPLNLFMDKKGKETSPLIDLSWLNGADVEVKTRSKASDRHLGKRPKTFSATSRILPISCVAGYGIKTETQCILREKNDKVVPSFRSTDMGDGVVPFYSATWLAGENVRTFTLPLGFSPKLQDQTHNQIWNAEACQLLLKSILYDEELEAFVHASLLFKKDHTSLHGIGLDAAGKVLKNAKVAVELKSEGSGPIKTDLLKLNSEGKFNFKFKSSPTHPLRPPFRFGVKLFWEAANGAAKSKTIRLVSLQL